MTDEHIVKSFDQDLRTLHGMIAEMGGLAEVQLEESIKAMVRRDAEKAARIVAGDKRIDDIELEMSKRATQMIAMRQPMADDLRAIIVALKVSSILERIGDYGKNVAKRVVALSKTSPLSAAQTIAHMGALVQVMIKDVLDAYIAGDADKADDVRLKDEEVDALHTSLFRELITYMMEDPRNITAATHLLFIAKNIERIGDHVTNIAENVHFLVHGKLPDDERPKGDTSSYTVVAPSSALSADG